MVPRVFKAGLEGVSVFAGADFSPPIGREGFDDHDIEMVGFRPKAFHGWHVWVGPVQLGS